MIIYKINSRDQLRSALPNLLLSGIFLVIALVVAGANIKRYSSLVVIIPVFLIFGLPAIILHIIYWRYNKGMIVSIENDEINIQTHAGIYTYKLTDIILAEKIINGSPAAKEYSRQLVENYGYIKLEMKNGEMFYLTSLMLDPKKFDIIATDTIYSPFPIPNKRNYKQKQRLIQQEKDFDKRDKEAAVNRFVEQFKSMSDERLREKLISGKNYRPEAMEAAKRILEQRKTSSI
ncbi:MAG: hypothetical protein JST70_10590 [Bacteroidetes bacterium]|nr:hypothetical protein [Bacteroidota bacterium]